MQNVKRRDLRTGGCTGYERWVHDGMEGPHFTEAGGRKSLDKGLIR